MKTIKNFIEENKIMSMLIGGVLAIILLIVIIFGVVACVNGGKIKIEQLETKMLEATVSYYSKNANELPSNEGEEISITLESLIEKEYLKPLEKLVGKDILCSGNVVVKKNGNYHAMYPMLSCGDKYATTKIYPILTSNIVTEGEGLYEYDTEYVYRGEYVNNYVNFGKELWRIVSINKDGNIRMIRTSSLNRSYAYDDRYNVEVDKSLGINIFETSRIKEILDGLYMTTSKGFDETDLSHLVAHDVCIAPRNKNDIRIDKNIDCREVYSGQFISIPHVSEYYRPSIDENCTSINRGVCSNYNYFSKSYGASWSSNVSSDNSYTVFTLHYTTLQARNKNGVNIIIELDNKEIYAGGTGTLSDPYTLRLH